MELVKKVLLASFAASFAISARAIDHANLGNCEPMCNFEDSYPILEGAAEVKFGIGYMDRRAISFVGIDYGILPNAEIGIRVPFLLGKQKPDGPESTGAVEMEALYNFNTESRNFPALGIRLGIISPGIGSQGAVFFGKFLATKSWEDWSFHLNAGYMHWERKHTQEERGGIYTLGLGVSRPVGDSYRTTAVLAITTEQSWKIGRSNITRVGPGLQYQLSPNTVMYIGSGTEIGENISPFIIGGFRIEF